MNILVVLQDEQEVVPLINWADTLTTQEQDKLFLFVHRQHSDKGKVEIDLQDECEDPFYDCIRRQALLLETEALFSEWSSDSAFESVEKACSTYGIQMVLASQPRDNTAKNQIELTKELHEKLLCDLLLIRGELGSGMQCKEILVPVSGGPHAEKALAVMTTLARARGGRVTPLHIIEEDASFGEVLGQRTLQKSLKKAGVEKEECLSPQVILANDASKAISDYAKDGFDLVVMGASRQGAIRKALFGTIPDSLLKGSTKTSIAIFRAAPAFIEKTGKKISSWAEKTIPQLTRQSRIELSERLHDGSKAGLDFVALICFSTGIASLGLIQNSVAVIIGAMLVAPLMTPMLGAGLGLVQGNIILVKEAIRSITIGFFLSLFVGFIVGFIAFHNHSLTLEMTGRGAPNLLDLGVAFISGMAAAYALARPGLLAALPGVAISAALVPPIATVGISLAAGETHNAFGSALLFGTNLVAIILSSSIVLFLLGVRPRKGFERAKVWVRRGVIGLMFSALLISVPLSARLLATITKKSHKIEHLVEDACKLEKGVSFSHIKEDRKRRQLIVYLFTSKPLSKPFVSKLRSSLDLVARKKYKVTIVSLFANNG